MRILKPVLVAVIIASVLLIIAISLHSVEEIHYLKSFYPAKFTVEEAFYATMVEFIKIHIISLPLIVIILLALFVLRAYRK
ncbi:MAG: hypothetical protein A2054_02650 [Deltaproteobacteria bacterium GWA2_55_10]|nr:MAG: hypothetical protein A2054_02650 [Deltaproteobacteria bacterium GWA2_55_10]